MDLKAPHAGECRKSPPTLLVLQTQAGPTANAAFAPTSEDCWCDAHQAGEPAKAAAKSDLKML